MKLKDKVVLVTGGGRGIGRAIALALAREGARLAIAARTVSQLDRVAEEIRDVGRVALAVKCDVTESVSVQAMAEAIEKRLGSVDILVNNAGAARSAPLLKTDESLWQEMLAVNLTGTYLCTRAFIGSMIARGKGRVINLASVMGKSAARYVSAYVAAKHGVVGFTKAVALEVADSGVTVNAICPGYVDTEMTVASIKNICQKTGMEAAQAREILENLNPQKRLLLPEEVADLAVFLASDISRGINGQAISICGGQVLY